MNLLTKIGLAAVALLAAFAVGRYMTPTKVETKEVVKTQVKTEVEYRTIETKRPDGTVVKEVVRIDKTDTKASNKKESLTLTDKPKYRVSIIPSYNYDTKDLSYGAGIDVRIAGPFFVGVQVNPKQETISIPISMEF